MVLRFYLMPSIGRSVNKGARGYRGYKALIFLEARIFENDARNVNNKAVAILQSTAFYPWRLFCLDILAIGHF